MYKISILSFRLISKLSHCDICVTYKICIENAKLKKTRTYVSLKMYYSKTYVLENAKISFWRKILSVTQLHSTYFVTFLFTFFCGFQFVFNRMRSLMKLPIIQRVKKVCSILTNYIIDLF